MSDELDCLPDHPRFSGPMAMDDQSIDELDLAFFKGGAGALRDEDVRRMFATMRLQKKVLAFLFSLFKPVVMRRFTSSDPLRNSTLAYMKEMCAMREARSWKA